MLIMLLGSIFIAPGNVNPQYVTETVTVEMRHVAVDISSVNSLAGDSTIYHTIERDLTIDQMLERDFQVEQMAIEINEPIILSDEDRKLCGSIIATEAGYQNEVSQILVAQSIYNRMKEKDVSIQKAVRGEYANKNKKSDDQINEVINMVFDQGRGVTDENVKWFYNPDLCKSSFHEHQKFIVEIGGHRYFGTNDGNT